MSFAINGQDSITVYATCSNPFQTNDVPEILVQQSSILFRYYYEDELAIPITETLVLHHFAYIALKD